MPEGLRVLTRAGVAFRFVAPPAPVTSLAAVHRAGEQPPAADALLGVIRELWPEPRDQLPIY